MTDVTRQVIESFRKCSVNDAAEMTLTVVVLQVSLYVDARSPETAESYLND